SATIISKDGKTAENGFAALASYDDNKDGVINAKDKVYSKLMLWQDADGSGICKKGSLTSLKNAGVKEISLKYEEIKDDSKILLGKSSQIRLKAYYMMENSQEKKMIADIYFKRPSDSGK
ncbi:MAG: hypothetical protein HQK54_12465, partial [Oligoflexales bacterium]|nr:hypothetical protein [Oligoflexales bacterium]